MQGRAFPSQEKTTGFHANIGITEEVIAEREQTLRELLERKPAVDRFYQIKRVVSKTPDSVLDTATRINLLARSLLRFAWAGVLSILLPLSLFVAAMLLSVSLELLGFAAVAKVLSLLLPAALLSTWPVFIIELCLFILIALACACLASFFVVVIVDFATATKRMSRW